ncbi:GNAT family N-acetyltransferase [Rummeliibacillus sp. JY-2-4R]
MDIFLMKASFPLDELTIDEMKELMQHANTLDQQEYSHLFHMDRLGEYMNQGFVVLAYNEQDQLLGYLSAIDLYGLNTYEWSAIVHPDYRRLGIGTAMVQGFASALAERDALGEMALTFNSEAGHQFLEKMEYEYSSTEATLHAIAKICTISKNITVRPFEEQDRETLIKLMHDGFGDLPEETNELITYNTETPGRTLYMVEVENQKVATVSLVENDMGIWITAFTVQQLFRRKGIGSAILQWAKNETFERQQENVLLDVEIDNRNALSVYKNAEFTPIQQVDFFIKK